MTDLVQLTYWDETTQTEKDCYPVVAEQATRNIGEIVTSTIPLTDAGLHLLDGALLQYGSYQAFIDYIVDLYDSGDYTAIFCTEAEWQTSVTTYGVCGKFVYDSVNNTVRLPKITGLLEGTTDVTALGDLIEQYVKLPNITGRFGTASNTSYWSATGAFTVGSSYTGNGINNNYNYYVNFDASRSSSVYSGNGSDTKIQQQAIKVLYYIVIATSTKTDIQVDIDDVVADLNGKADVDLSNTAPSISFATAMNNAGIRTVVEIYQNGTSWYRIYSDKWCEQGGYIKPVSTSYASITLLKTYKDANYSLQLSQCNYSGQDANYSYIASGNRTNALFQIIASAASCSCSWQASGYIN